MRTTARAYASRKEVSNVVGEVSMDLAGRPGNGGGPSGIGLQEGDTGKRRRNEKEARKDLEGHNLDSLKRKEEGVLAIARCGKIQKYRSFLVNAPRSAAIFPRSR